MNPNLTQEPPMIAGAKLHDGRTVALMDYRTAPIPLYGKEYPFAIMEVLENGFVKHVEGGIGITNRRAAHAEFEIFCKEASGLQIVA